VGSGVWGGFNSGAASWSGATLAAFSTDIYLIGPPAQLVMGAVAGNIFMPGNACAYIYENTGPDLIVSKDGVEYIYENTGYDLIVSKDGVEYIYDNTGASTYTPKKKIGKVSRKAYNDDSGEVYVYENVT
jgi:hypothetical protein